MPNCVITNDFRQCGFSCDQNTGSSSATILSTENVDRECSAQTSALLENVSFANYVDLDEGVHICGQMTNDAIIASVQCPEDDSSKSEAK